MVKPKNSDVVVVGAGISGVMSALSLLQKGHNVSLIDRWEPGHGRASSSDFNRVIRSIHGKDAFYTRWARDARLRWLELQAELGCTIYVECGALVLAGKGHSDWEDATADTFVEVGVPHSRYEADELRIRFPQFDCGGIAYGLYEPEAGLLMAHRIVVESVKLFQRRGGALLRGGVVTDDREKLLFEGKPLEADLIVVATGPWLGDMYPRTVRPISKVVRQNIIYTSTPEGDCSYDAGNMPCWIDHEASAYGVPSVEGHGVKAAIAWSETVIDLDNDERVVDQATFTRTRQYLRRRIPGLVGQRAVDQKACQIAMTPDTHFIIDHHPEYENVLLVGGCSGHLFKHGPVLGDFVAGVGVHEFGTAKRFKLGRRHSLALGDSPSGR